jgi:hypothetical protein
MLEIGDTFARSAIPPEFRVDLKYNTIAVLLKLGDGNGADRVK